MFHTVLEESAPTGTHLWVSPGTTLRTRHGELRLPAFLPDATRGVVRGLDSTDLERAGVSALMLNSFHLSVRPGTRSVQAFGGAHAFAGWPHVIATDSGGFQVFSLIRQNSNYGTISSTGATFRLSPSDKRRNLTPAKAIQAQLQLGSDLLFCLDDCTGPSDSPSEQRASVERTISWARACRQEFDRQIDDRHVDESARPLLFAVVQGGNDRDLRLKCADALAEIGFDGYGFGGWPVDSEGVLAEDALAWTAEAAPTGSPLHALGVGKPENVVTAYALGYRLFDCALPTRDGRHGRLFIFDCDSAASLAGLRLEGRSFYRTVHIADERHRAARGPLSECCPCLCCRRYSLGYLHHLYAIRDTLAFRLGALHNLTLYCQLMTLLRERDVATVV